MDANLLIGLLLPELPNVNPSALRSVSPFTFTLARTSRWTI